MMELNIGGKYDENNNLIYQKTTNNFEEWYKYNKTGMRIKIVKQEFENIKIREYMSREKVSRFELMDI